jgi:hypothetical protein
MGIKFLAALLAELQKRFRVFPIEFWLAIFDIYDLI